MENNNTNNSWESILPGAVVFPFKDSVDGEKNVENHQENREYSHSSFYTQSVAHWRTIKPIYNTQHCINCYQCWVYCPDSSILVRDEKMKGVDYKHCKGCGVCAEVCPTNPKSLIMYQDFMSPEDAIKEWPQKQKKVKE